LRQVTILSGKGGTGKTSLTASFAVLAGNLVVADCDVDASNLHLLLNPKTLETQEFKGSKIAVIDESKCTLCHLCEDRCHFGAISDLQVDDVLCEGCGLCAYICPSNAIEMREKVNGYAYVSKIEYGYMSHARLNPGEENSGKLVTLVRHNARLIAEREGLELVLSDGPPGIGCPVIASLAGADLGVVVAEPTMSGIHDMERALSLLAHFQIKPFVCINKCDLNVDNTRKIEEFCRNNEIGVAGKISFDTKVTQAMAVGKTVVKYLPESEISSQIRAVWQQIQNLLKLLA
jgi:MinD superfamily P-loop ATPase